MAETVTQLRKRGLFVERVAGRYWSESRFTKEGPCPTCGRANPLPTAKTRSIGFVKAGWSSHIGSCWARAIVDAGWEQKPWTEEIFALKGIDTEKDPRATCGLTEIVPAG